MLAFKLLLRLTLTVVLVPISFFAISQATFQSTGTTTDWNTTTTWTSIGVPDDDGNINIPDGDDDVIINGHAVTMIAASACKDLTINNAGSSVTINANLTFTINGNVTLNGTSASGGLIDGSSNNHIVALTGTVTIPAPLTVFGRIGGVRFTQTSTSNFTINGTFQPSSTTGTKTLGNVILNNGSLWNAAVNETYATNNFTIFDGAEVNATTVNSTINIGGNLLVQPTVAGLHSKIGRVNITTVNTTSTTTVNGYWEFSQSNAGAKIFNGTITINPGATWDNIVGEDPRVNCSIVNNGLWPVPTGGNGRYDVTNATGVYTYSGNSEIGMTRLRLQNGATVTNTATLRLTRTGSQGLSVESGSTFINGANGYLKLESAPTPVDITGGGSTVNFSTANNTVEYLFAGNQNVHSTTYYNLICSSGSTKTVNGATVVNSGALTINGSTLVDVTGGTDLNGTGSLVMNGTSQFQISSAGTVPALTGVSNSLAAGTTIILNRAGIQTAASSASYAYRNLTINGNAGSAVNMSAVSNVLEDLTFANAGTMNTNAVLTVGSDFNYGSSATTTLANNITVGNFIASSGGLNYSSQTITINGNDGTWTNNGCTFTDNSSSIVAFTTGTNQTISGTSSTIFRSITINNPNGVTLELDATASSFLTFSTNSGNLYTGTNNIILTRLASNVVRNLPTGFVEGNLRKSVSAAFFTPTFEVGSGTTYAPLTMSITGSGSGAFTVSSTAGDSPDIFSGLIQPDQSVNRYWSVTNNALAFTSVDLTFNFVAGDIDVGTDITNGNVMVIKGYNNSTLTWFTTPVAPAPVFGATSSSFTGLTAANLLTTEKIDFQIGEVINPTFVFNRLTGTGLLWNDITTWIQLRTGLISVDLAGNVTGTLTNFSGADAELVDGDKIMLQSAPGTVYTIVAASRTNDVTMQITPPPGSTITNATFGRQYIPGINSPTTDVDAVTIGNTNIGDATTTITLDINAKILSIDVGSTARNTAQALTHQNSTRVLTVLGNATINQPGASVTNAWNINAGTASVAGDLTIGGTANNTTTRVSSVVMTTGTASINNLKIKTFDQNGRQVQAVLDMSGGAGTLNISGSITFINSSGTTTNTRGTLTSSASSTINFNRTSSTQSIVVPNTTATSWVYNNINCNNTSAAGAVFGFTTSATSVTGDVRIQTGKAFLGNFNIVGAAAKTFQVAPGATFEMNRTATGAGDFPTGFGTFDLGTTGALGTVIYNQDGNGYTVSSQSYGHLIIGPGASRTYTMPNATINVAGNLTIGDGTTSAILAGTTATTLNVTGNILINANSTLNATNISNVNLGGNWTNNGAFTESTNSVTLNSPAANTLQTIGGTTLETFYNLTVSTSALTDVIRPSNNTTITNNLVLTQGEFDLNGTTLSISNNATTAISRTNGYIKGEKATVPYGEIKWQQELAAASSVFVYPFGKSTTEYIPFTFTITSAASGGTSPRTVAVSTYGTPSNNLPIMSPAANLNGTTGGTSVVDRYWAVTLNGYSGVRPTVTMDFVATDSEIATTGLNPETPTTYSGTLTAVLAAQRWSPSNYWDDAIGSPSQTYTQNTPGPATNTGRVQISSWSSFTQGVASPWVLVDQSVPLPVELTEFTASAKGGIVELNWKTASELSNDFFLVERSSDGETFEKIAKVDGAGTITQAQNYLVSDFNPLNGRSYYRLQQTDFDGKRNFSHVVTVEIEGSNVWYIYPNPSDGAKLNLQLARGAAGNEVYVSICDMSGKTILTEAFIAGESGKISFEPINKLAPGAYIVSVLIDQKINRHKLIVK